MRKRLDELYKVELVQRVKVATHLSSINVRFHLPLSLSIFLCRALLVINLIRLHHLSQESVQSF